MKIEHFIAELYEPKVEITPDILEKRLNEFLEANKVKFPEEKNILFTYEGLGFSFIKSSENGYIIISYYPDEKYVNIEVVGKKSIEILINLIFWITPKTYGVMKIDRGLGTEEGMKITDVEIKWK